MKTHSPIFAALFFLLFSVTTKSAVASEANDDVKARFSADVIFSSLPIDEVKRLLANELKARFDGQSLQLDSSAREIASRFYDIPEGHYPVIYFQGTQSDMTDVNNNIFVVAGRPLISYNESVFMIPHLMFKGKSFNYMKRLYLDKALPVLIGKQKYGYDKVLGEISTVSTDTSESASVIYQGVTVAQFNAEISGSMQTATDLNGWLTALVGENFISFGASSGDIICTRQAIQVVNSSLYPIRAQVKINKGYFNEGAVGSDDGQPLYSLDGKSSSVKLVYDWTLFAPNLGCQKSF
jgi:Acetoacetate decarboxylase (ADC)